MAGPEGSTEQVVAFVRALIDRGRLRPGRSAACRTRAGHTDRRQPSVGPRRPARAGGHGRRPLAPRIRHIHSRRSAATRIRTAQFPGGASRLHARGDVRSAPHSRGRSGGAGGATRLVRTSRRRWPTKLPVCSPTATIRTRFSCTTSTFIAPWPTRPRIPSSARSFGMVSALYYERRRETAERASDSDLRDAAEAHRRIYQSIRARDAEARAARDERSPRPGRALPGAGTDAARIGPSSSARGTETPPQQVKRST